MKIRLATVSVLMLGLSLLPYARAEPPARVQKEINYLLRYVEVSGCEFYRNGSWYDSKRAEAHLRDKYEYLAFRNLIDVAEDFIARAATESGLSGTPYEVKCSAAAALASNQWLREELARYRALQQLPAGRAGLPVSPRATKTEQP